jgi:hypothetical protein
MERSALRSPSRTFAANMASGLDGAAAAAATVFVLQLRAMDCLPGDGGTPFAGAEAAAAAASDRRNVMKGNEG